MHMSGESLIIVVLVGIIAGWLAGQITRGADFGLVGDLIIGILGAFIGSWLLPQLGIQLAAGMVAAIANSTIGAVILLFALGLLRGRGAFSRCGWSRRWQAERCEAALGPVRPCFAQDAGQQSVPKGILVFKLGPLGSYFAGIATVVIALSAGFAGGARVGSSWGSIERLPGGATNEIRPMLTERREIPLVQAVAPEPPDERAIVANAKADKAAAARKGAPA